MLDFRSVAASVAATRALFGNHAKNTRTILASEQNFTDRLSSLLSHGKKGKLAGFCGVEASTVSRWLSGLTVPAGETQFKIAEFLGVDAKWLMSGANAQSSTIPNEAGIGDSTCMLREEPRTYGAELKPELTVEQRLARLEWVMEGMAESHKRIADALEEIVRKQRKETR